MEELLRDPWQFTAWLNQADEAALADALRYFCTAAPAGLTACADRLRRHYYGRKVFFRGLIEFSSYCRNDCLYCGFRRSNTRKRTKPTLDQVAAEVRALEDQGHKRLEPILEEEEASALVRSTVEQEHTYERDMVRENGQVTMTERVTVHPRLDLGSVRPLGIYYVPIWCVEGTKGVMVLNASTGKVLSEDYFRDIS